MVAGIVLVALGLKKTMADVDDPLKTVPAFALIGGVAIYLLGLVAFRWRHVHTINASASYTRWSCWRPSRWQRRSRRW